jgi:hypothetical protein
MRRGRAVIGGAVAVVALVLNVSAAFAGTGHVATHQGYPPATAPSGSAGAPTGSGVAGASQGSGVAGVSTGSGGTLPFTGLQLGIVVLVGALLIGGGLVLRGSARSRTTL